MSVDDDASDEFGGMFENGHWEWDEEKSELKFISDASNSAEDNIILIKGAPTGAIRFRDDVDFYEQMRFKHRYQRKVKFGQRDVITLQDVKDVAIFTAPTNIMSEVLINMLHRTTTERFIRALIFYCQYYLQIVDIMSNRKKILEKKVRTPQSEIIENEYRDNLCDLRLLVAKQYCTITIGGVDMKRYHHMGIRKRQTLTDRDARLYETFIRICVQIVWLTLGRMSFNLIELEVNRLFKTETFNSVEHNLQTGYITDMSPEERNVILGHCVRHDTKLNTRSPLVNEVFCHRNIDYRLMSISDVKHDKLTPRLRYFQLAVTAPEEDFESNKTVVGILGMLRTRFDPMLNAVAVHHHHARSKAHLSGPTLSASGVKSASSMRKSAHDHDVTVKRKLFPDIILPPRAQADYILPESFPDTPVPLPRCNAEQRDRWINRLSRILNARKSTIC